MYDPLEFSLSQWEIEQEQKERNQPVCDKCGEPLHEYAYDDIEVGERWCEACGEEWLEEHRRRLY